MNHSEAREMLNHGLVQQVDNQTFDTFRFAGKYCDSVTLHVVTEMHRRGMVKTD